MDVTKLRLARQASEQAEAFLRLANRLGRVAAWRIEVPSMRAAWSTELLQLLGIEAPSVPSAADLLGLVRQRQRPDVERAWRACVERGDPLDLEVPIVAPSGRPMWVRLLGEAGRDANGAITHVQGAVQDISESKEDRERLRSLGEQLSEANAELTSRVRERTRELESANTQLKSFAHALAHDLKQPIVAVQMFSAALDEAIALGNATQGTHLNERIKAAGVRMLEYIDALLSLAETSQAPLHITTVDLSEMAGAVLDELQRREPARRLVRSIQPGLVAHGDRRLLRMLLENLLGNAWKFTARRPEAHVTLACHTGAEGETIYTVQDNGAGFDMAQADRLFGNFQRLHASGEFAGTGVGLANVQRIVVRHGGRIWAEGRVGEGATFSFTLAAAPD
jgi:signal transduction histidine kinase